MQRRVEAREPVPGSVVPPVAAVVEVELGALVLQSVDASLRVDQELHTQKSNGTRGSKQVLWGLFTFVLL